MKIENIKVTPKWNKAKEAVWAECFEHLSDKKQPVALFHRVLWMAAAAVIAIAILLPAAAYIYTTDVIAPRGSHISAILPDGSNVELNADSRLTYKPYWWQFSRSIKMSGEAYFEVAKGKRFTVYTPNGTVAVLGTSFNVLSRSHKFDVACLTGEVEVKHNAEALRITAEKQTRLENGKLIISSIDNSDQAIAWVKGLFSFQDTPLQEVIEEIERQYNIEVVKINNLDFYYTGNFPKDKRAEDVLKIIGKPFGIELRIK